MKTVRYTAAVATILMSLLNLPFAVDDGGNNFAKPLDYLISLLGLLGIGAAVALLLKQSWAPLAVLVLGAVNLIGAVIGLVGGMEGAIIGLVLSAIVTGLGLAALRLRAPATARTA